MRKENYVLEFRLRFPDPKGDAFGPGKADLLERIGEAGSIRAAASAMEMSYNRAWMLVRSMNLLFETPLVTSTRGGNTGGGATLTSLGSTVLAHYRRMEKACAKACAQDWAALQRVIR